MSAASRTGLLRGSWSLIGVAALAAGLVSATWILTSSRIAAHQERSAERALAAVLTGVDYDNALAASRRDIAAPALLGEPASPIWTAYHEGRPVAWVLRARAPDGYAGSITLLVGLTAEGVVSGVEVLAHRETPGLGDFITTLRPPWLRQFPGAILIETPPASWSLVRDGGEFDAVTGATVTSRAVLHAIRGALAYFTEHRDELLGATAAP